MKKSGLIIYIGILSIKIQKGSYNMTTVEQSFKEAKDALYKINNELFYEELKDNLKETADRLEDKYSNATRQIDSMSSKVGRLVLEFEDKFEGIQREFITSSEETLESLNSRVSSLHQEQNENNNQVLDNFVSLQQEFLGLIRDLENLKAQQDKQYHQHLIRQNQSFEQLHNELKEELMTFTNNHNVYSLKQTQQLNDTFNQFVKKMEEEQEKHLSDLKVSAERRNKILIDNLTTNQKEIETSLSSLAELANQHYDELKINRKELHSKLMDSQNQRKELNEQIEDKLSRQDDENRKMYKRLMGIGAGITTLQVVLIILQVV